MKRFVPWVSFLVGLLIIAAVVRQCGSGGPASYQTATITRGPITQAVTATGTLNPVVNVQVGSQVSGNIAKLFVDFNSQVKAGQVVAQIDPALFQGTLLQARADFANAKANLIASKANLEKAKATAIQTKADYDRTRGLAQEGVMSQQQLDLAKANSASAEAAVAAADAQVTQAAAQEQQKDAAVKVAETNLNYTTIHAPIDGTVIARSVDVGQTVAASLQAPTLFTIAQDLTKMQVYASTDESDVGMIRTGQEVTFKVDAYPKDTFTGRVSQVRMNATTVQNVVTYNTIIDFDNPQMKLFPGMTAYITIPVANAENVVRVPNGAIRYKPDMSAEQIRALYKQYGLIREDQNQTAAAPGSGTPGGAGRQYRPHPQGTQGGGGGTASPGQQNRSSRFDVAVVWKLRPDKTIEPVRIRTGITDHTVTEVTKVVNGELKEGDELVTGAMTGGPNAGGARPPGMTTGPGAGPRIR